MGYKVEVMPQKTADNYYEMLYRFSKVLKKLKLKYWLEGGTLIGAIREGSGKLKGGLHKLIVLHAPVGISSL